MNENFGHALVWMDQAHQELFSLVPSPKMTNIEGRFAYRFTENSIQQAIILKLARIASGLRASVLLLESGLLQEQASMCRMIDEYQEDIVFLALALNNQDTTDLHKRYLSSLFQEELRPSIPKEDWHKGRSLVGRKQIRAFIANQESATSNPSDHTAIMALLANTYSGYVHATAVQVLEMYDPSSNRFLTSGQRQTPFFGHHRHDLKNYFARGIFAFGISAKLHAQQRLVSEALKLGNLFAGIRR